MFVCVQSVEWTVIASMHEPRSLCGAAVLDDQIIVVGGSSGTLWSVTLMAFSMLQESSLTLYLQGSSLTLSLQGSCLTLSLQESSLTLSLKRFSLTHSLQVLFNHFPERVHFDPFLAMIQFIYVIARIQFNPFSVRVQIFLLTVQFNPLPSWENCLKRFS